MHGGSWIGKRFGSHRSSRTSKDHLICIFIFFFLLYCGQTPLAINTCVSAEVVVLESQQHVVPTNELVCDPSCIFLFFIFPQNGK